MRILEFITLTAGSTQETVHIWSSVHVRGGPNIVRRGRPERPNEPGEGHWFQ